MAYMGLTGKAGINAGKFKLFNLFVCADGVCRQEELRLLAKLAEEMRLEQDLTDRIRQECELGLLNKPVTELVEELVQSAPFTWQAFDRRQKAAAIWELVHLGYCDREYSQAEQQMVATLAGKWKIKPEMLLEFTDTADTLLMLSGQQDWVAAHYGDTEAARQKVEKIDETIREMYHNVQVTISQVAAI